jgi:hypothetical protein
MGSAKIFMQALSLGGIDPGGFLWVPTRGCNAHYGARISPDEIDNVIEQVATGITSAGHKFTGAPQLSPTLRIC